MNSVSQKITFFILPLILYVLIVSCAETPSSSDASNSDYNVITAFSFKAADNIDITADVEGMIAGESKTIRTKLPVDALVTALVPTIQYIGSSIYPSSGEVNDFTKPTTYTVTAENGVEQDYSVLVEVDPGSICGNAIIETGESCDDGNSVETDGCPTTCRITRGFTCTTNSVCALNNSASNPIVLDGPGTYTYDTSYSANDVFDYYCFSSSKTGDGRDLIFSVSVPARQTLDATLDGVFDEVLVFAEDNADLSNSCLGYKDIGATPSLSYTNATDLTKTIYVIMDGYNVDAKGVCSLIVNLR